MPALPNGPHACRPMTPDIGTGECPYERRAIAMVAMALRKRSGLRSIGPCPAGLCGPVSAMGHDGWGRPGHLPECAAWLEAAVLRRAPRRATPTAPNAAMASRMPTMADIANAAAFFHEPVENLITSSALEAISGGLEYRPVHNAQVDISRRELAAPTGARYLRKPDGGEDKSHGANGLPRFFVMPETNRLALPGRSAKTIGVS